MGAGGCYRRICTRDTVRLLLAPALVFIATSLDRGYQTDLWQHLARGRLVAQERAVVSDDRFTFTAAGQTVYDNNWLSQLLYYGVHSIAGLEGVQVLNSLALAATFALLVDMCRRASGSTAVAAAAGVLAFFGLWPTFLIRPQTFSMLLFVGLYALLEASRRRPRLLIWVPPTMALWANVHGGFAVGLALVFGFALGAALEWLGIILPLPLREKRAEWATFRSRAGVRGERQESNGVTPQLDTLRLPLTPNGSPEGEREKRIQRCALAACLFVSAAATLANPYGWGVYRYAGKLSALGVARGIEEWLPPSLSSITGVAGIASLGTLLVLGTVSARRPTARDVCLLGCFAVPACLSVRMTVWWFLIAAPIVARWGGGLPRLQQAKTARPAGARPDQASPFAAVSLATIAVAVVLSLPWFERYQPLLGTVRPNRRLESDVARVAAGLPPRRPPARVFTRMEWANYLTWSASDRSTVFVDGHVELYPDETWRRYLAVTQAAPGWERVLDGYAVDYLLLDETYHVALLERVRQSGRWSERARAGPAVLFGRRAAPPTDGLAGGDF